MSQIFHFGKDVSLERIYYQNKVSKTWNFYSFAYINLILFNVYFTIFAYNSDSDSDSNFHVYWLRCPVRRSKFWTKVALS